MIYSLFVTLEATSLHRILNESNWMFPALEAVHLCALALFGGTEILFNLRLMGFGLSEVSAVNWERETRPWAVSTLLTLLASGMLLFTAEPLRLYDSPAFLWKMIFLLLWIAASSVNRARIAYEKPWLKISACASLAFWLLIALAGRWVGFS